MTHTPDLRSTALAGSRRVDVEAAIAPILLRAMDRFDEASFRLDQRVLWARPAALRSRQSQIRELARAFYRLNVAMNRAFSAGFGGR
ncbi:hypothetical protein [Microcella alkaliphila]|uniref:Putative competence-damage inducible protein n=1 Tax=Microcella alkaliphila TaxID=279828 RepID=A0A0U5B9H7_9MICO|nr:hypothetical protein [Microcella alkaliphila]BAU32480.1 putative competence-damage inducible protein [Microcella alkaliphila]